MHSRCSEFVLLRFVLLNARCSGFCYTLHYIDTNKMFRNFMPYIIIPCLKFHSVFV